MQNWKKALVCGALGAGAVLTLAGRRTMGLATMLGGLGLLASEYPEQIGAALENAPEYVGRASHFLAEINRLSEQIGQQAPQQNVEAYADFI